MSDESSALDIAALSEVMHKSVEELSDADIDLLISALRAERARFKSNEAMQKRTGKSPLTKAAEAPKKPLSFEDLGL